MRNSRTTQYFYEAVSREISAHKKQIIFVFACITFAKIASFSIPYFLKLVVDSLSSSTKYNTVQLSIIGFIVCYSLLQIASTLFNEIKEYLSAKFTHNAVVRIGEKIFYRLLYMNMNFHIETKTGVIARDVDRGLKGIQSIFGILVYSIAPTVIELILVTTYFYIFHDIIYLTILGCSLSIYLAYSIYATNKWAASRHEINQSDSNANQKLLESLINIETVKYFTTENHELNQYRKSLEKYAKTSTDAQAVHSKLAVGQQLIIALCLGCTLWQASLEVANGSMTVGDVILINGLLLQVFMPLSFLGIIYKDIRQCIVDVERLATIIGEDFIENSNRNIQNINSNINQGLSVEFNNVSFSYFDGRKIFDSISFKIPAGSTTAIVGTSGSGKSTIVKLILKAYDVSEGVIRVNDTEIHSINTKSLRQVIGVIPQEISLFNGTIYYNIQYGDFESSNDEVIEAAQKAQIHDFINSLKDGYQTIVGERGLKLSGGERQRVAIARALIKSPSLLIFDEATSALDTNTENQFQQKILESIRGKTILIIAHRLSTVIHANTILVFDKGKIVESGTHNELMSLKGVYFRMWEKQSGQS